MADVRAMLRAERANRPVPPKSKSHAISTSLSTTNGKKRKADYEEADEVRKRAKTQEAIVADRSARSESPKSGSKEDTTRADSSVPAIADSRELALAQQDEAVSGSSRDGQINDDEELDDFIKQMESEHPAVATAPQASSGERYGTITGNAMTMEELAAQKAEATATPRGLRDEDVKEEKDDAVRELGAEFEQVQEMETRVLRLRELREKVRQDLNKGGGVDSLRERREQLLDGNSDAEEEEDEDEWDAWTFRPA